MRHAAHQRRSPEHLVRNPSLEKPAANEGSARDSLQGISEEKISAPEAACKQMLRGSVSAPGAGRLPLTPSD
eukprot:3535022-Pyramimonas_sp.AAC.1